MIRRKMRVRGYSMSRYDDRRHGSDTRWYFDCPKGHMSWPYASPAHAHDDARAHSRECWGKS